MLECVIATTNKGKLAEFMDLTKNLPITCVPQSEFGLMDAVEETGQTFVENALIKARAAAKISGLPAIADDSGLCVDALEGAPGLFSSRYAGENATAAERNQKLLQALVDVPLHERSACFHSVIVMLEDEHDPAPLICHGVWFGDICESPRGSRGFGYDPIFYVSDYGCTAAELDSKIKNTISHRGLAMRELSEILTEVLA